MSLEGSAEAASLKAKMEAMNKSWDEIQAKSKDKQEMLEDALREVKTNIENLWYIATPTIVDKKKLYFSFSYYFFLCV